MTPVSNAQAASGSNSLHLDNSASNVPDPVLPFGGQTWTSGSFEFTTNLYVETTALQPTRVSKHWYRMGHGNDFHRSWRINRSIYRI